ncbi:sensor histidine kinase [Peterkaempfera bronchialis]|uniref:histidine kinase n=1 Tax=Peterkaempfera bronchialis TaxID=2126346 RepID=A0A345T5I8_9ACTN|nr:HAMP domain-containing protein [Peterkaempfera bronchialis]
MGVRGVAAGWTTRRWLWNGVGLALVVLGLLGALGGWALVRTASVTDQLVDHSSPALTMSIRLQSALVNQETGIRGYGLSGQRDFLQPYTQGLADEQAAATALRRLTAGDPRSRADLTAALTAAERWQSRVARPVAAAPAEAAVALAAERADEGKAAFDAVRSSTNTQIAHLQARRSAARADLDRAVELRNLVFAAISAVILLLAVLIFEGLRRGVTAPLEQLSADARQVARGRFDHRITPTGPADLRRLAEDVEAMRRRLSDELAFTDQARRRLDEQATELRRSNTELEQFAYVASHDLQEPLRKVASFCQLLERRYADQLDDRAKQYIAYAVDGANRMQTLINDLLAFSRVGRLHSQHTTVDLERVLADTLGSLSVAVEESGAEIGHDPLPQILGDTTQLGMLWQNLLSNAIKFRDPGRAPRIRIEAERQGDHWQFSVTDNGIGIDPEYADRVFVIFQRLHTKDAYPGNGIGLAMCKKVVEFHRGTIRIDLDHSPGTRLVFTLPALPEQPGQPDQPDQPDQPADGARAAGTDDPEQARP